MIYHRNILTYCQWPFLNSLAYKVVQYSTPSTSRARTCSKDSRMPLQDWNF